jgi:HEPN domain-containing protein
MKKHLHIPLAEYSPGLSKRQKIFQIIAKPDFSPIDFNIKLLVDKKGWGLSDRFRFWFVTDYQLVSGTSLEKLINPEPHISIRKLDIEEDCFCHCEISLDGNVKIHSNDSQYAEDFFSDLFINFPPSFHTPRKWKTKRKWIKDEYLVAFFVGSLQGALGRVSEEIPKEIKESFIEATQALEAKHYRSCVVMCRRVIEAVMRLAYRRFFKTEPKDQNGKDFSLYKIIRKFQKNKPDVIPSHLINALEYIRNLGNIPGAHPKPISKYRFTRQDAEGALYFTQLFVHSYFNKIDKEIGKVYTLKINLNTKSNDTARNE